MSKPSLFAGSTEESSADRITRGRKKRKRKKEKEKERKGEKEKALLVYKYIE